MVSDVEAAAALDWVASASPRSMQAAVGRAVLAAGQADPTVAAVVRAAVRAAPQEDQELAADLIAELPGRKSLHSPW